MYVFCCLVTNIVVELLVPSTRYWHGVLRIKAGLRYSLINHVGYGHPYYPLGNREKLFLMTFLVSEFLTEACKSHRFLLSGLYSGTLPCKATDFVPEFNMDFEDFV